MKGKTRAAALILSGLLALACAGCSGGAEDLYALPRLLARHERLLALVGERLAEGFEYAAPLDGARRQRIQLHDLDGDGQDEALAFLADADGVPAVCVYRLDPAGEYYLEAIIGGEGPAVECVDCADLDGDGADELILVWRTDGAGLLSVYRLTARTHDSVLSADCADYALGDLDGDGTDELMVLDGDGSVGRYAFGPDGGTDRSEAALSRGAGTALRVRAGGLTDGRQALFVDSRWDEDELITDVFAVSDGRLENITAASGRSNTLRRGDAFSADIGGDGVMELPEASGDVLNWYSLDSSGRRTLAATTYHDYDGGWYLELGPALAADLSVAAEEDEGRRAATFSVAGEDGVRRSVLTVCVFTGLDRLDRAEGDGWTVLARGGTAVWAARLLAPELMTEQELAESFHLIRDLL